MYVVLFYARVFVNLGRCVHIPVATMDRVVWNPSNLLLDLTYVPAENQAVRRLGFILMGRMSPGWFAKAMEKEASPSCNGTTSYCHPRSMRDLNRNVARHNKEQDRLWSTTVPLHVHRGALSSLNVCFVSSKMAAQSLPHTRLHALTLYQQLLTLGASHSNMFFHSYIVCPATETICNGVGGKHTLKIWNIVGSVKRSDRDLIRFYYICVSLRWTGPWLSQPLNLSI